LALQNPVSEREQRTSGCEIFVTLTLCVPTANDRRRHEGQGTKKTVRGRRKAAEVALQRKEEAKKKEVIDINKQEYQD